jgi:hypothetical protein
MGQIPKIHLALEMDPAQNSGIEEKIGDYDVD